MTFKAILTILSFIAMSLMLTFRPNWVTRWGMPPSASELKRKVINKFVQIIGVIGLIFAIYATIYTLFFVNK